MPRRRSLFVAGLVSSILLVAGSGAAIAAPAGMKAFRATGALTSGPITVTFDAKVGSSSGTWALAKGAIHVVVGEIDFRGAAYCGGTTPAGNHWTAFLATNLGSTGNPSLEAVWTNYFDGNPDGWTGLEADSDTDCAALALFALHDEFLPAPIDSGWVTVR